MFVIISKIAEGIGIVGVVLLLTSYYLLNTQRLSAKNLSYQLFNFFGSWFILFSLFFHWNTAAAAIEIAWIIISVIGIFRAYGYKSE